MHPKKSNLFDLILLLIVLALILAACGADKTDTPPAAENTPSSQTTQAPAQTAENTSVAAKPTEVKPLQKCRKLPPFARRPNCLTCAT